MTSEPEQLAAMRVWLRRALGAQDVGPEERGRLVAATSELCANSIRHAYGGRRGEPITVSLRTSEDEVMIEVDDRGRPFDPSRYRPPDLDAAPERGLGLHIARVAVDHLSFDVNAHGGNHWTLLRRRARTGSDGGERR